MLENVASIDACTLVSLYLDIYLNAIWRWIFASTHPILKLDMMSVMLPKRHNISTSIISIFRNKTKYFRLGLTDF